MRELIERLESDLVAEAWPTREEMKGMKARQGARDAKVKAAGGKGKARGGGLFGKGAGMAGGK